MVTEKIEILGLDLFQSLREEMAVVERVHGRLGQNIGWHYYLDFAWILSSVRDLPRGSLILDAGAGWGLMQFILVELGYNVISADFADRPVPGSIARRYGGVIHRLNSDSRRFVNRYTEHLKKNAGTRRGTGLLKEAAVRALGLFNRRPESIENTVQKIERKRYIPADGALSLEGGRLADVLEETDEKARGRLFIYKCDVRDMELIPDGFVDAVVSVSALEHNDHAEFEECVRELSRVTKEGGRMAITVSASQEDDWFHEPSKGWCFSEPTLRRLFGLSDGAASNYSRRDELFETLREQNNELHKRLSPIYYKIGTSGMPWGVWDPKYQPVGVLKVVQ